MHKFLILLSAVTMIWAAAVLVLGSDVAMDLTGIFLTVYGGVAFAVMWFFVVPLAEYIRRRQQRPRVCLPDFAFVPVLALVLIVLTGSGLTFKLRFLLSETALTNHASEIAGHEQLEMQKVSRWVGLFHIASQQVLPNGVVRLVTTSCFLDTCGLAYSLNGEPPHVGEDSYQPVAQNWWAWIESW
jgi:hypothetical protein